MSKKNKNKPEELSEEALKFIFCIVITSIVLTFTFGLIASGCHQIHGDGPLVQFFYGSAAVSSIPLQLLIFRLIFGV